MSGQAAETQDHNRADVIAAIAKMRRAGVSINDIAADLGVKKWFVSQACQRLNLTQKDEAFEKPIRYDNKPFVSRRCVVCRNVGMLHPSCWTCPPCKEEQNKIDKSVWDKE